MNFITTPYCLDDLDSLKKAGADSIVVSNHFYAVRGAAYIEINELPLFKKACNRLGMAMYVQVNRFFMEEDLPRLRAYLTSLKELNVEGIYFGDEGVLQIAKELHIENKLIYNPDTLITNKEDVKFYLAEGIKMVTLSKDITLEEILAIADYVDGNQLEVIIHGRLNMMHSKRNLLSNYMKFIKQDKNLKNDHNLYIMEETRDDHMPILEDESGTHVFTGYTLASFVEIKAMQEHGIQNVRIDGIFQNVDTLCQALNDYHDVMNRKKDGHEVMECYKKDTDANYSNVFYYTKTSKTK